MCLFCLKKINEKCNNYIHKNGFTKISPKHINNDIELLENWYRLIKFYFAITASYDGKSIESTDYIDYIENGEEPPDGCQQWIAPIFQDFIDAEYLDGLVRVYKEGGITKAIQLTKEDLCTFCVESGAPADKISPDNIIDYYNTRLFADQLKGMFAETIVLVEGATEFFALPVYLK